MTPAKLLIQYECPCNNNEVLYVVAIVDLDAPYAVLHSQLETMRSDALREIAAHAQAGKGDAPTH